MRTLADIVADTDAERDPLGHGLELRETIVDTLRVCVAAPLELA